jgi:LysM repeat protein
MDSKPLFITIMFVFLIVLFAGAFIGDTDLTPNTPPAAPQQNALLGPSLAGSGQAAAAGGVPVASGALAVAGTCANPYTVQPGDTLSGIAQKCGVSLADLLATNPTIQDPHLIRPGDLLSIVAGAGGKAYVPVLGASAGQPVAETPAFNAGVPVETPGPAELALLQAPLAGQPARAGIVPGGAVNVTIVGLPASAPVDISIGRVGFIPVLIEQPTTGPDGRIRMTAAIPWVARPGEAWEVTVSLRDDPRTRVVSAPFFIEE